jgi:hypothetical protein
MQTDRSPRSVLLTLAAVAALVASACNATGKTAPTGGPASVAPSTARPAPSAAPGGVVPGVLLAVGRAGETDLRIIESRVGEAVMTMPNGAPDASWGHILNVGPDGNGTRVQNLIFGENSGREIVLDGRWQLPTIGSDPVPAGRSLDDSTFALVGAGVAGYGTSDGVSRFAILRAAVPPADGPLTLVRTIELKGAFDFDALSPNGSILYVVEHLATVKGAYQVRSIPVATGVMDKQVVVDKRNIEETMAGAPITQIRRADGTVMTLYRGTEHPFVHALGSVDKWAFCIDLPANGADDADAAMDWGLTQTPDSRAVYAINATLGLVVDIDPNELTARRTAQLPAATASQPAIVLAKFGHEAAGPLGRRAVVTQDGETILAGGRDGLVAVRTKDLTVAWRALAGEKVASIALTADGNTAFVLLGSGRIVAVATTDGSAQGAVPGEGYDRLVAITG